LAKAIAFANQKGGCRQATIMGFDLAAEGNLTDDLAIGNRINCQLP